MGCGPFTFEQTGLSELERANAYRSDAAGSRKPILEPEGQLRIACGTRREASHHDQGVNRLPQARVMAMREKGSAAFASDDALSLCAEHFDAICGSHVA